MNKKWFLTIGILAAIFVACFFFPLGVSIGMLCVVPIAIAAKHNLNLWVVGSVSIFIVVVHWFVAPNYPVDQPVSYLSYQDIVIDKVIAISILLSLCFIGKRIRYIDQLETINKQLKDRIDWHKANN